MKIAVPILYPRAKLFFVALNESIEKVLKIYDQKQIDGIEITLLLFGWTQRKQLLKYFFYKNNGGVQLLTYDEKNEAKRRANSNKNN